jgi:formate/nitrite transporter
MAYIPPHEFVKTMVDSGESKVFMSTQNTLIRSFLAGAIIALAVTLAATISVQTGYPIAGALVFPVGFCLLNLLGFDLLTGVFVLAPLAFIDKRADVKLNGILRNWLLVAIGNILGAVVIALLLAISFTYGFSVEPNNTGQYIAHEATQRTLGYAEYGLAGWLTALVKGILGNWMVSSAVVCSMLSRSVAGKVVAMWLPIVIFYGLVFEHAVVNMFIFPFGIMMGAPFTIVDWLVWNQVPVMIGNLIGGLGLTGLALYLTYGREQPA